MSTRRRFTGEFKAKVALEALRGDKTIQEIATPKRPLPSGSISITPRGLILPSLAPPQPRPTKKHCHHSCSPSPTACLPLCRLNQNTKS